MDSERELFNFWKQQLSMAPSPTLPEQTDKVAPYFLGFKMPSASRSKPDSTKSEDTTIATVKSASIKQSYRSRNSRVRGGHPRRPKRRCVRQKTGIASPQDLTTMSTTTCTPTLQNLWNEQRPQASLAYTRLPDIQMACSPTQFHGRSSAHLMATKDEWSDGNSTSDH